jgi:hypothetical protein
MTDLDVRALARRLEALEAQVGKRGSQLAYSALEDGAIREFDLEGTQVAQYGTQYDGTHVAASLVGPPPPQPTAPTVQGVAGGLLIGWDGLYAGGPFTVAPMDYARCDVVVGPVGFSIIGTQPATAIMSPRGGLAFVACDPGTYEVSFVIRSQSGAASPPSDRVQEDSLPAADSGAVTAAQDAADQAIADALAAYILAGNASTAASTADAKAVQAQTDASNALTAAGNAVTAAGGKITAFRQASAPATTGRTMGDLWIDTDDGLLYVWTGAWTASPDQRIATVVTGLGTKVSVFAQTSAPSTTGRTLGDLWIDTDDGNRQYVWEGSWVDRRDATIAAAASLATQAKNAADSKITVYRQSSAPTGTFVVGDLWLDTDDGLIYYASTTAGAWTLHSDQRIGLVVTSNATKTTVFAQISQPATTGRTIGDLWIDTDDGNKLYDWSAGAWNPRLLGAPAISATARQLGAVIITRQSSAPASGMVTNDLWLDTDDGLLYIWTGAWTLHADQRIATVVSSNATKTTGFAQTSAPSTTGRTVGDVWFDTDDNNRVYVWEGAAWVDRRDATIAAASALAQQAKNSADAKISVYRQSSAPTGTFVVGDLWLDTDDGLIYYASTTAGGWTLHADQRVGLVVTSNAAKTTVFYQTSAPSTTGRTTGDVWIDSDDADKFYRWSGSAWVVTTIASAAYIASRGTNLVTNGTGMLGNNTNFSGLTFDGSDAPVGAAGSFKTTLGSTALVVSDEFMPVDPTKKFRLSVAIKNKGTTTAGGLAYTGLLPFDAAKLPMDPGHYMYIPGTTTTLAAPLNPGDTTVTLTSAAGWYGAAAKPGGAQPWLRRFIFWDYVDPFGKAWATHTYSRNLTNTDMWADGGVVGNVITLRAPYAGPAKPAGTSVSNGTSGGSYMYGAAVAENILPAQGWRYFAQTYASGTVVQTAPGGASAGAAQGWPPGIGFVKFMALANWLNGTGAADTLSQHAYALISFSDAAAAQADADAAGLLAAGKATIYRQSSAPATAQANDMWVDSDDGLLYVWTGSWTLSADQRIAAVVASDAVKVTAYAQTSQPPTTGRVLGDIWVDTDDSNKIYIWDGAWTVRLIGSAAISATARQLGAVNIYRQSAAPASGMATNDLWVDSDDGLLYVYTGTWTLSADQRVATLVTQNATQISAFYQTSAPSTTGRTLGDLWFDSDDGYRPYIWTGAWTNVRDTTIATADAKAVQALSDALTAKNAADAAQGTANTALSSANGKTKVSHQDYAPTNEANTAGDVWFVHDTLANGGNIIGQYRGLGGTSWQADAISHQVLASIDLGKATVGRLAANYLESGTMSAAVAVTGYLLSGNPVGARVVIDKDGIRQYTATGDILVNLSTDPDVPAQFEGTIQASSLTVLNNFTLRGIANEISKGAVLTVSSGTTAPGSAPSIAVGYDTFDPQRWSYLFVPTGIHANIDDSGTEIIGATTFFGYGEIFGRANRKWSGAEYTDSAGTKRTKYGNIGAAVAVAVGGVERLVINSVYTTANGQTATGRITSLDTSVMNSSGTVEPTLKAQLNIKPDDYLFYTKIGRVFGGLSGTQYPDRIAMGMVNWNSTVYESGKITLRQYTVTDNATLNSGFTLVTGSEKVIGSPLVTDELLISVTHGRADKLYPGLLPSGVAATDFIWLIHGEENTYAYHATTMARIPDFDFPTPPGAARMHAYGDVVTNQFLGFRTTEWSATTDITKLTNNHWITGTSAKWWLSQTWYDADVTVETAPAGGAHETAQGPRASITMKKRAGLVYTIPTFPERPFPTTTDDVLQARIYLGRSIGGGLSDPGRTYMERQATLVTPNRSGVIGNVTFPATTASSPPPVSSNFPATAPGKITSADGAGWVLAGDGKVTMSGVVFDPAFPGLSVPAMRAVQTAQGGSVTTNSTTTAVEFTSGPHITFVAPPSGSIMALVSTIVKSGTAGDSAECICYLRTGASSTAGSIVTSKGIVYNYNTQWIRASGTLFSTNLTPGATYNLYLGVRTNTSGTVASVSTSDIVLVPIL